MMWPQQLKVQLEWKNKLHYSAKNEAKMEFNKVKEPQKELEFTTICKINVDKYLTILITKAEQWLHCKLFQV